MFEIAKEYLQKAHTEGDKVLLGLSGGPDSKALFHLLQSWDIAFEAVYVNHGWRKEALEEERVLLEECSAAGIFLHIRRLSPMEGSNLEDRCREKRREIFCDIVREKGLSAVILGHHNDDQVETVLKRLFEGSYLSNLRGISKDQQYQGVRFLRPMLPYSKKEIISYLERRNIPYFTDQTNTDNRFLRARMRTSLLPMLEESFGKNVSKGLTTLSSRAGAFTSYMNRQTDPLYKVVQWSKMGAWVKVDEEVDPFVYEYFLRRLFSTLSITLSKEQVELLVQCQREKKSNKGIKVGDKQILFDQERLIILPREFSWQLVPFQGVFVKREWSDLFAQGIPIEEGEKELIEANLQMRTASKKKLKQVYVEGKVPACLRTKLPVIKKLDGGIKEVLTKQESREIRANHLLTLIDETHKI